MSRHSLAMAKDFPQLLRLRIEIISGTSCPSSFSRPGGGESQVFAVQLCYITKLEAGLQTQADLSHSISQLFLDQLVCSERATLTEYMV